MINPLTEELAVILFETDGFDPAAWNNLPGDAGVRICGHYRKLAEASIAWAKKHRTALTFREEGA